MEMVTSMHATYTFALQYGGNATFYIPQNGYPSGAAVYLLAAHLSDAPTSLADRFHRANRAAELTSPGVHKNLSYQYAIDLNGYLFAYQHDSGTDEWEGIFSGHYAEFINGHAPFKVLGDGVLKQIKALRPGKHCEWVTRGQLVRRHVAAVAALAFQCERFPERADVIASYRNDVDALALALQQYNEDGDFE
ncbi:hypothetical protein [Burkholderia ubonensis]|uniref:DUF4375 domain-containing protein n=1 Tax=Burkholderia ubonensis TaxID=101571 RepID=A0AB74CXN0_9BURK|nr:hypothetical protein [Burkholderia ubonensis]PAJ80528.1 hypothetical protein CJO71_14490 [Burkholderia ubonensis]PAJ85192.1 hypothetical protein CJO70_24075 [Burkholderia ubonensis]PAJ92362.1 hypothetical protein CJO69_20360 [Burkholderia ubonensis]PAK00817.1 hypothetical protein CJO68_14250 [Burkholderia ubonensis]PAK05431.1 hypothetical protein CJO67_24095 [Burkholderia ubonensis]